MGSYNETFNKLYCRGKSTNDREWVSGWVIPIYDNSEDVFIMEYPVRKSLFFAEENTIYQNCICSVIPNTVCRCIGEEDCCGKEIFEDDIVRTNRGRLCRVKWFSSPSFIGWDLDPVETKNPQPREERLWKDMVVVGNIYDNPELLGNEFYN